MSLEKWLKSPEHGGLSRERLRHSLVKFDYDGLSRLTAFKDGPTNVTIESYVYDATGNRKSVTSAGGTQAYTYPSTTHRLSQVGATARTYDNAGNTTAIGGLAKEFVYDDSGRMSQIKQNAIVQMSYAYNGKGEQVRKQQGRANTYTVYDEAGHWLGDYDNTGYALQQAIWMNDLPVGFIANGNQLHYIEPDHLGTPRVVVEVARNVPVWTWDMKSEAFGNSVPNQDPDLDANSLVFNMRLPGQRYDAAAGLNQNYFRDYDPSTGRYVQSDPIGLAASINTYAYVDSSPLLYSDPLGLTKWELEFHLAQYQPAIKVEGPFGIKIKVKGPKIFNFGVTGYSPCVNGRRTTVSLDAKFKGDYDASSPLPLSLAMGSATLYDGLSTINTDQLVGPTSVSSDVRWNTSATGSWTIAGKTVPLKGKGISGDFEVAATLSPTKWHGWEEDCTCE